MPTTPGDIRGEKAALRARMRSMARRFGASEARAASEHIREHLAAWLNQRPEAGAGIAIFAALPGEPDLVPLISAFPHLPWHLPRVEGDELRWHRVADPASLRTGKFGILEPDPASTESPPGAIDLFFVPGLAFDPKTGTRLGRGRGFYDRALAEACQNSRAIGVCFDWQRCGGIPAEAHDRAMNALATESGLRVINA